MHGQVCRRFLVLISVLFLDSVSDVMSKCSHRIKAEYAQQHVSTCRLVRVFAGVQIILSFFWYFHLFSPFLYYRSLAMSTRAIDSCFREAKTIRYPGKIRTSLQPRVV